MFINFLKYLYHIIYRTISFYPVVSCLVGYVVGVVLTSILDVKFQYPSILIVVCLILVLLSFLSIGHVQSNLLLLIAFLGFGVIRMTYLDYKIQKIEYDTLRNFQIDEESNLVGYIKTIYFKNGNTIVILGNFENYQEYSGYFSLKYNGKLKGFVEEDKIRINARLQKPENYEGFNYSKYLQVKNIFMTGEIKDVILVERGHTFRSYIGKIRYYIIDKTRSLLSEPESSLLLGLTIGYRGDFDDSFEESLKKTGTTHIIAVSGYNVSLLVVFVSTFFSVLGRKTSSVLIPMFLLFYCLLTGFNIPVIRASLMFSIIWFARNLGRDCSSYMGLTISTFILTLINPFIFWDISFLLTFFSTLGLIVGGLFNKIGNNNSIIGITNDILGSTIWAFVFTFPIIIYNFSSITLLTFISNLLVLPLINLITVLGVFFIISFLFGSKIVVLLSLLIWPFLNFIHLIIDWVASFRFGVIDVSLKARQVVLYYSFLFVIIGFYYSNSRINKKYG